VAALWAAAARAETVVVDDFEDPAAWTALPADGVWLRIAGDEGLVGRALRLDFDFHGGGGYAVARRVVDLPLPEHYRFRLTLRGETAPQNFEFKLVDSTGANVWWSNRRGFTFPERWDSTAIRERQIEFAWGPAGGGKIRRVAALEIAVTAGSGGSGTVWLDRLTLEELPPPRQTPLPPVASASSTTHRQGPRAEVHAGTTHGWRAGPPAFAADGDSATAWESGTQDRWPSLTLDLGEERELGGLVIRWASPARKPRVSKVEISLDGRSWRTAWEISGGRLEDFVYLPECAARFLRLAGEFGRREAPRSIAVREVEIEPLAWSATRARFFGEIARRAPRGHYPRGMLDEMVYWTVVGADGGPEGLLSEDGALETGIGTFSVEPFLALGDARSAPDTLATWAEVVADQWLEEGRLPIPSVRWRWLGLELVVTALAGEDGTRLHARYVVRNPGRERRRGTLHLAIRPFQVNPPVQSLKRPGGTALVRSIQPIASGVIVNDSLRIDFQPRPRRFAASTIVEADLVSHLRGESPAWTSGVREAFGAAWGVASFDFDLASGDSAQVALALPLRAAKGRPPGDARFAATLEATAGYWRETISRSVIEGPPAAREALETLAAQVGYVLVNRKGPAIQPGSRSYDRTWIRDGSLTSAALLRLGHADAVGEFLDWFAPHQYANGKIPCCVDERGADPVPEHDASGEFIYLVAEHYRYTQDRERVERLWPAVAAAAGYLDSLRQLRRTAEWRRPETIHFFGLLPPSISHEGYSAAPMHSYWDDFFALRGFRDAAYLAALLGRAPDSERWRAVYEEFARELGASVRAAMAKHGIDFVPGSADLGDFDATSTTIALSPTDAESVLPFAALERTFERYYEFFRRRRDGGEEWQGFTPYEWRNLGAFVRLGWRERAEELLDFFLRYRRPAGWREWAEVVWRDERAARFVGDMPHTWVGTDYVRSLLDAFAYERASDSSLVLAAGLPLAWVQDARGVRVRDLRTPYGVLSYGLTGAPGTTEAEIEGGLAVPPGGILVAPPLPKVARRAWVDGAPASLEAGGKVRVRALPALVRFEH
jgi:hypothetical protein